MDCVTTASQYEKYAKSCVKLAKLYMECAKLYKELDVIFEELDKGISVLSDANIDTKAKKNAFNELQNARNTKLKAIEAKEQEIHTLRNQLNN